MTPSIPLPTISAQQVLDLANFVGQIETHAPFIFLLPGQLQAQGGTLFPGSDMVVFLVAQLLMDKANLFPGCPENGRDLMNSYAAVSPLRMLLHRLQALCDAARDTLVALQASNLRRALLVLSLVKQQDEAAVAMTQVHHLPPSSDQLQLILARKTALVRVYHVIDRYYDSLKRKKSQSQAARQAAHRAEQRAAQQAARDAATLATSGGFAAPRLSADPIADLIVDPVVDPAADPVADPVAEAPAPGPTASQRAQSRAQLELKDAVQLKSMEEFEDQLRGAASPASGKVAPCATAPHAFSISGMRRHAVRRGDRSVLKPPKHIDSAAMARQRTAIEFMSLLVAQRAAAAQASLHQRE